MKTLKLIPILTFLLCFPLVIQAQSLKSKIQKSVVEIGKTFPQIPSERLKQLDQAAFSLVRHLGDSTQVDVVFIDNSNEEISQLAMIWLETGMIYYGHSSMFNIQSAAIAPIDKPLLILEGLKQYGYNIRNVRGDNPMSYKIDYGSGNWIVYPKPLESLNSDSKKNIKIYLEKNSSIDSGKKEIELLFANTEDIPKEMLYMSTRINNLLQRNQ